MSLVINATSLSGEISSQICFSERGELGSAKWQLLHFEVGMLARCCLHRALTQTHQRRPTCVGSFQQIHSICKRRLSRRLL